jgi:hypothetical protein
LILDGIKGFLLLELRSSHLPFGVYALRRMDRYALPIVCRPSTLRPADAKAGELR